MCWSIVCTVQHFEGTWRPLKSHFSAYLLTHIRRLTTTPSKEKNNNSFLMILIMSQTFSLIFDKAQHLANKHIIPIFQMRSWGTERQDGKDTAVFSVVLIFVHSCSCWFGGVCYVAFVKLGIKLKASYTISNSLLLDYSPGPPHS